MQTGKKRGGGGLPCLNALEHLRVAREFHVSLAKWHKSFNGNRRGIAGVAHGCALVIDDEALAWQQADVAANAEDSQRDNLCARF